MWLPASVTQHTGGTSNSPVFTRLPFIGHRCGTLLLLLLLLLCPLVTSSSCFFSINASRGIAVTIYAATTCRLFYVVLLRLMSVSKQQYNNSVIMTSTVVVQLTAWYSIVTLFYHFKPSGSFCSSRGRQCHYSERRPSRPRTPWSKGGSGRAFTVVAPLGAKHSVDGRDGWRYEYSAGIGRGAVVHHQQQQQLPFKRYCRY